MPPKAVKTIKEEIYYQYAKIISESAGYGKQDYRMIMGTWKKLCSGEICWSTSIHEWVKEMEIPGRCDMEPRCKTANTVGRLSVFCIEGVFS